MADVMTTLRTRLRVLPGYRRMSPSLPQTQSGCLMIHVPGQFLQEMTRIGQGGFDDWSSHFLQTYNKNQSYHNQFRKHNVLAAITDVVLQNVLFLRKFQVLGIQTPAVDLLLPPVHGCGSRLSSGWTPTSLLHECSQEAAKEVQEELRQSLGERRVPEPDIATNGRVCCDIIQTTIKYLSS